jgi:spore coat polysaccharide biosynthesis predicted glycosyltransferase SpsG
LSQSPTKEGRKVNQIIAKFKPQVVVFDASGRADNFKFAKKMGAKVIFISQHKKKMNKGLKLNRLPYIDEHLVVQPKFMASLSWLSTRKLHYLAKKPPTFVGSLYQSPDMDALANSGVDYNAAKSYILVAAGSGSHYVNGGNLASDLFYEVALYLAAKQTKEVIFIAGINCPKEYPSRPNLQVISHIDNSAFTALLRAADMALLNGGSTLLQAIDLLTPSVAVAVAKDQPERIKSCVEHKLCLTAKGTKMDILAALDTLVTEEQKLKQHMLASVDGKVRGMDQVISIINNFYGNNGVV